MGMSSSVLLEASFLSLYTSSPQTISTPKCLISPIPRERGGRVEEKKREEEEEAEEGEEEGEGSGEEETTDIQIQSYSFILKTSLFILI